MDPSMEIELILDLEQFDPLQALDSILFDEVTDNATKNVEKEAHFVVGEKEKPSTPNMLVCPLCGSKTTNITCLDEMLAGVGQIEDLNGKGNGGSSSSSCRTEGIFASQMHQILNQRNVKDSIPGRVVGAPAQQILEKIMAIEETSNNASGSSSNGWIVGSPMDHCGDVGISNKGNATRVAGNAKTRTPRPRYRKGSPEAAHQKELRKFRNREAAARSFARKQAYFHNLELRVLTLQKENTFRRNALKFLESYPVSPTALRQLRRTTSASV